MVFYSIYKSFKYFTNPLWPVGESIDQAWNRYFVSMVWSDFGLRLLYYTKANVAKVLL